MIVLVTYHVKDADYEGGDEMVEYDADVGILTATEDLLTAFKKIDEHYENLGDSDVEYLLKFYRNGEEFTQALVVGGYDAAYDEIKEFLKEFYH